MKALKFLLIQSSHYNSDNSIAATLADILASVIPLHSTRDGPVGHETPQEVELRMAHEV